MTQRDDKRRVRQAVLSQPRRRQPARSQMKHLETAYNTVQKYARGNSVIDRIVRNPGRLANLLGTMQRLFGQSKVGKREIEAAVRVILSAEASQQRSRGEKAGTSPTGRTPPRLPLRVELPPVMAEVVPERSQVKGRLRAALPIVDATVVDDFATAAGGELVDPQEKSRLRQAAAEVFMVSSSNVHSFYFVRDGKYGTLYVTFLAWRPGMKSSERSGAGPTYAYFDIPVPTYLKFKNKARFGSAGGAVWDFLRVRGKGNASRHQYQYQLTRVQRLGGRDLGKYVPRRITRKGLRTRSLPDLTGRSQLAPRDFKVPLNPRERTTVGRRTVYR